MRKHEKLEGVTKLEEQTITTDLTVGNIVQGYCDGCDKINKEMICTVYLNPTAKCRIGCAFSPKVKAKLMATSPEKKRVGQQKQKKKK